MSRKHFEMVAAEIKDQVEALEYRELSGPARKASLVTLTLTAKRLATVFRTENPLFDRQRFLEACGVGREH
jgi:hypothetical protein